MLYISGLKDTLKELKEKEGFTGSLEMYEREFAKANPKLVNEYPNYKSTLPPYMPMYLVTIKAFNPSASESTIQELNKFSLDERKALREMQEEGHEDISMHVILSDIMESFQEYANTIKQWLKTPMILTPWEGLNMALTNKHLFKTFGETSKYVSTFINRNSSFQAKNALYEAMFTRDALNRQLYLLRTNHTKEAQLLKQNLLKQIKEQTYKIRELLPKKIKAGMSKYLHKLFTEAEIAKIRKNITTPRNARRMQLLTTNLDVLNRTGLDRLRKISNSIKTLGEAANIVAKILNWGVVTYDTAEAYRNGKNFARTFFAGATSIIVASEITAAAGGTIALGGLAIGAVVGDAAIGTTLLICSPIIGWAVLLIAGVAIGGYISYKTKESAEGVWDLAEDMGGKISKETSKAVEWIHGLFKSAWDSEAEWLQTYYGEQK